MWDNWAIAAYDPTMDYYENNYFNLYVQRVLMYSIPLLNMLEVNFAHCIFYYLFSVTSTVKGLKNIAYSYPRGNILYWVYIRHSLLIDQK